MCDPVTAYRSVCSAVLIALAGLVPWQLEPKSFAADATQPASMQSELHGRVLAPDGSPVSGATVFTALPGRSETRIRNGVADVIDPRSPKTVTDTNGEYSLPSQQGKFLLVALDDAGFVQADQDAVAKNADVRLAAWGRLHGRLMIGTKPGPNMGLQAEPVDRVLANRGSLYLSIIGSAQTDAGGNFTMDRLLPGLTTIDRTIWQQPGGNVANIMGFSGRVGAAQIVSGQTTTATIGGIGRPVVGNFIFPEAKNPDNFFVNARADSLAKTGPTTREQFLQNSYLLEVALDHSFRIDNVTPGDYEIHIFLQKVHGDRALQSDEPRFTMPPIPAGVSDDPLVIPDIQLQ
jgi:hypothetical protein